ncbi:MAG: helix-turn-helix domain-containing protein [Pseudomonadota bacterium]
MTNKVRPTAQVEPFVRVLGEQKAIEFLLRFGGAELYLSRRPRPNSTLAKLVGRDQAAALAIVSDRLPRRIPTAKPWIAKVLFSQGRSKASIARELHVSDVSVRKWLKDEDVVPKDDDRQLPLF